MEIIIGKGKQKRRRDPHFKVTVSFMEGDADGYQSDSVTFTPDEEDHLKKFIMACARCCAAYPRGRGGYDEYHGLPEYDAYFLEDYPDPHHYPDLMKENGFVEKSLVPAPEYGRRTEWVDTMDDDRNPYEWLGRYLTEKYNPGEFGCDHPSDTNYISTSFDGYSVEFIDENGDKRPVTVNFTKDELAYINEAANILN